MTISLYRAGQRLYVEPQERLKLLSLAKAKLKPEERTFCEVLIWTGCRISEARSLTKASFDFGPPPKIIIQSLKKRRSGVYRAVPIPIDFIHLVDRIHNLNSAHQFGDRGQEELLWSWGRTKAWEVVKKLFAHANIVGSWANPKGLRHGFAINALNSGVPITSIKQWMGHASLETTQIYLQVMGQEEYEIAQRMWWPP